MGRFCQECGKKASPGNRVCIHCGSPLPDIKAGKKENVETKTVQTKRQVSKKKPLPKKKKVLYSIIGSIIVILIGFIVWAQSYQSPQAVEKRFYEAVANEDAKVLQKLLVHEDGSSIKKEEAKAFLKLIKEEGERAIEGVVSIKPHGKFLFLFTAHKIEAIDQHGAYYDPVEDLSLTFNKKEVPEYSRNEEKVIYGPLIPGIYKVEAVFEGKYGQAKKAKNIILNDMHGDDTNLDIDVNVSNVKFFVDNYDELNLSKAHILLGEEKIKIDKEGYTKEVGPVVLDGSQKVHTIVTMPWGEVKSSPMNIESSEMELHAEVLNKDQYKTLKETLKDFGENYVQAFAKKSTKPLKSTSDDVKSYIMDDFPGNTFYSGKFEKVEIDRSSIQVDKEAKQPQIEIAAQYYFQEAFHDIGEDTDLYEGNRNFALKLSYNKDKKSWKITSVESLFGGIEATDTEKGSNKLHGPSKKTVANAKNAELEDEMAYFMEAYVSASVDAINYRDFTFMEDYTDPNGPRWKEAKDYIDYLDSKDIYEDWLGTELESVKETAKNTWEVTVVESFTIYHPDSSKDKTFRTKVIVKRIDGGFKVHELIETNEI